MNDGDWLGVLMPLKVRQGDTFGYTDEILLPDGVSLSAARVSFKDSSGNSVAGVAADVSVSGSTVSWGIFDPAVTRLFDLLADYTYTYEIATTNGADTGVRTMNYGPYTAYPEVA